MYSPYTYNEYPPTSPERRACETRYHQPTYYHLVRHPTAMTASISNSARPSSSRQPSNLGSKATAQAALGDSCFWQPRQDAANLINYLLIGAKVVRHRLPQAADPEPPCTRLGPQIDAPACTGMPISSFGHPGYSCFWQPGQDAANLINYLLIG